MHPNFSAKISHDEIQYIVIDLFSGAGGTSTGIERASLDGDKIAVVIAAVNHDPIAIQSHALNHRFAVHFIEDIRNISYWQLEALVRMNRLIYPNAKLVIWASAECTNYSKAKGGQPRDADSRTLPEALYEYVNYFKPDILQVENVVEFMSWGELDNNGRPISRLAGTDYLKWAETIRRYGYEFSYRIMNAADYGGYTSRVRFFGQFVRQGQEFVWPEPTHAKNPKRDIFSDMQKWKPVKDVLDLWDEGKSIFDRKKPLCEKTLERIYAGLIKFVANGDGSFITKYYSGDPMGKNISLEGPSGALTTKDGQAVVFISKYNSTSSTGEMNNAVNSIENPSPTLACQNRISLVQAFMQQYHGNGVPVSIEGPATAITTKDRLSVVHPVYLLNYQYKSPATGIDEPSPTLLTKDKFAVVSPQFFSNYYSGGGQLSSIEDPCPVITAIPKQRLISPQFIDQQYGNSKPSDINEPSGTLTQNPKLALVSAKWLMDTSFNNKGTAIDEPSPTLLACRKNHYLVNPQYKSAGGSLEDPCFTLIAKMDKKPPSIVTTEGGDSFIIVNDDDTLWTLKIKAFMAAYGIIDIKMRMLKIPEMLRIMGLGDDYKLAGTQTDQKKFIGNAVHTLVPQRWYEAMATRSIEKREAV